MEAPRRSNAKLALPEATGGGMDLAVFWADPWKVSESFVVLWQSPGSDVPLCS